MGTCLDWHSAIISTLPYTLPEKIKSEFALDWRQTYFEANEVRRLQGLGPEDIDITHRTTLNTLLSSPKYKHLVPKFHPDIKEALIQAWHKQPAWPDVETALQKLQAQGYELFVHANGTTRLQLDLADFSGVGVYFDMLFSSQLLGSIKPDPRAWERTLELIGRKPEECVQVAAHAMDTGRARRCGLKTVYVYRWTNDVSLA